MRRPPERYASTPTVTVEPVRRDRRRHDRVGRAGGHRDGAIDGVRGEANLAAHRDAVAAAGAGRAAGAGVGHRRRRAAGEGVQRRSCRLRPCRCSRWRSACCRCRPGRSRCTEASPCCRRSGRRCGSSTTSRTCCDSMSRTSSALIGWSLLMTPTPRKPGVRPVFMRLGEDSRAAGRHVREDNRRRGDLNALGRVDVHHDGRGGVPLFWAIELVFSLLLGSSAGRTAT